MKKINLVLGIHNHQPIGNFDFVFQHAHQHAYQPFLDLLEKYPRVKLTQHYSGILLEWLLQHRPGFIRQLKRMVASGQVEIMGGAYYEAILSIIPDDDKAGQLSKLSKTIKKQFGEAPTGMWLAERVWEQHLAKCIAEAGLQYTVVDDTHFKYAGFSEEELLGYYVTEEQGNKIAMFPISKRLRYTIPFQPVHRTIDYLREIATEEGNQLAVFADDGEKFGVWPNTFDHVYTRGWLEDFFQALSDNADWIHLVRFKDVLKTIPPLGLTYLPNASYAEMLHWALPSHHFSLYEEFERALQEQGVRDKYESFFKGGFWRNFLAKYPESNRMHKKMLHVSQRAQRLQATRGKGLNQAAFARIRGHIFASQCNDPYWHGIFGGVYLPVLRHPIYSNLIAAEKELDTLEKLKGARIRTFDYDCDGNDEVVVETPTMNCYFKPDAGGSMVELDFKPANLNVLDIVSRREEGYHAKLKHAVPQAPQDAVASIHETLKTKEPGLERYLVYDRYPRASLVDHFFAPGTTLKQVTRGSYEEVGDFVHQPYTVKTSKNGSMGIVELSRHGSLLQGGKPHSLFLRKTITVDFKGGMLAIDYMLRNEEQEPIPIMFGVEFNVGLQDGKAPNRYYYLDTGSMDDATLSSMGQLCDSSALGLRDEWLGVDIRIETTRAATLWRFPLEVVSLSEAGFERIFQSSVVIPFWHVTLAKEWRVGIRHTFKTLKQ